MGYDGMVEAMIVEARMVVTLLRYNVCDPRVEPFYRGFYPTSAVIELFTDHLNPTTKESIDSAPNYPSAFYSFH